jgi:hypothetical protein
MISAPCARPSEGKKTIWATWAMPPPRHALVHPSSPHWRRRLAAPSAILQPEALALAVNDVVTSHGRPTNGGELRPTSLGFQAGGREGFATQIGAARAGWRTVLPMVPEEGKLRRRRLLGARPKWPGRLELKTPEAGHAQWSAANVLGVCIGGEDIGGVGDEHQEPGEAGLRHCQPQVHRCPGCCFRSLLLLLGVIRMLQFSLRAKLLMAFDLLMLLGT